ncbi:MAG: hypothetical protein A2Z02_04460 [Chloroflexi bacterium RBG_16_48_7]|nr:MAG: hypothetical protein A2Z02_04460 [Chloroflexi bacterium RBG_16_48_7]
MKQTKMGSVTRKVMLFLATLLVPVVYVAFLITPVAATVTSVEIDSPTTSVKGYSHTGGILEVTFTAHLTGAETFNYKIQVLTHGTTNSVATQQASYAAASGNQGVTDEVNMTGVVAGTYDLRVGAKYGSDDWTYSDISSNVVIVTNTLPTITLLNPTTGSYIKGNTAVNIQWSTTSPVPSNQPVLITAWYYHTGDAEGAYVKIMDQVSCPVGIGSYSYTGFTSEDNDYIFKIEVEDAAGNTASKTSGVFYVITTAPTVILSTPKSTTEWNGGTTQSIVFTTTSAFSLAIDYKLQYSTDAGSTWNDITSGYVTGKAVGSTTYSWSVPTTYEGGDAQIKVTIRDKVLVTDDDTSASFQIYDVTKPTVSISLPATSTVWYNGQAGSITFTMQDNVATENLTYTVSFYDGTGWNYNVVSGSRLSGTWTIPYTPTTVTSTKTTCKIQVDVTDASEAQNTATATSGVFKTVYAADVDPVVGVTAPNTAGTSWQVGSTQTIKWTASDASNTTAKLNIKIEFATDGGGSFATIASLTGQTQGAGTYSWAVADNVTTQGRVRITATNPGSTRSGYKISTYNFEITAASTPVTTASITLYPGWNLISLQLIPTNTSIQNILSSATYDIESVWYYSGSAWTSYVPGVTSTLSTMADGKAYMIKVHGYSGDPAAVPSGGWPSSITFTFQGRKGPVLTSSPPTYSFVAGWNLMGYKSTLTIHSLADYLSLSTDETRTAYSYNHSAGAWTSVSTTENLTPGAGYWVYFPAAKTVAPPLD